MQHKKQQLKIDLDKISYCPHPEVTKAYKENNAEALQFLFTPEIVNEERIKLSSQASGKPVRHKITGIYRKAVGNKEYIFWHEYMQTFDYFGNVVGHTRLCGRYSKPVIHRTLGLKQGRIIGNTNINELMKQQEKEVSIDHMEEVHEWEFEDIKEQLQEWYKKGIIDNDTKLYAWVDNVKYTVRKFDDFINLSMDDLVLLGKMGNQFTGILPGGGLTKEMLAQFRTAAQETIKTEVGKLINK